MKFNFSAVYLSESWCDFLDSTKNSNYRLHGCNGGKGSCKGGGLCIFLCNTLSFKIRFDLNMNSYAIEWLCLEISTKLNYGPPNGDTTPFEKHMKRVLSEIHATKKEVILICNFNINLLNFDKNERVQSFFNLIFRFGMIPTKTNRHVSQSTLLLQLIMHLQILAWTI